MMVMVEVEVVNVLVWAMMVLSFVTPAAFSSYTEALEVGVVALISRLVAEVLLLLEVIRIPQEMTS